MSKISFCLLDCYPENNIRMCKDTAGGYGTGNNFGKTLLSKILNIFTQSQIHQPQMHVGYLLRILKNNNSNISYTNDKNSQEVRNADFVILTSSIIAHETEINALEFLEKLNKKTFVVGIFSKVKKDYYLKKNSVIIDGEPEKFFSEIEINLESLNNYFTKDEKTINVGFVENLDKLPFPNWEDYNKINKLKNNFLNFDARVAIPILATRGCPYSCFNYCTYPLQQGRKIRARSPENIVSEIEYWISIFKNPKFVFRDPVFSINRKHTLALCNLLIEKNIRNDFLIETHLNNLDDELIDLLKRSGLKLIYVGVESKHSDVLKNISRFTVSEDKQYDVIKKLEDKKIFVKSMFMIGNPEDNEGKVIETINYAKKLKNTLAQFSVFTPYPGTPAYKNFENLIIENKMESFNQYNLVFKHNNFNQDKINQLKSLAYKNFYFRFKTFYILLFYLKNLFLNK